MSEQRGDHARNPADEAEIVRMYTWRSMRDTGAMRFILGPCVGVSAYYAPNQQAFMGHFPLVSQNTGRQMLGEFLSAIQNTVGEQGNGARIWVGGAMNSPASGIDTASDREAAIEAITQRLPGANVTVHWQDTPDYFTDYRLEVESGQETIEEGPADVS